jgi:flagellar assembly factor FliW
MQIKRQQSPRAAGNAGASFKGVSREGRGTVAADGFRGGMGRQGIRRISRQPKAASADGVAMEIQSSRFGRLEVDDERIMTFPKGLLGFPDRTRFALIQTSEENYFFWLQCVDDAHLAFVITDPSTFFKEYEVPLREELQTELFLTDPAAAQVFVICNKVGDWLTGNLLGPIVVNVGNRLAQQVVLTEKKWTTRQPLMRLAAEAPMALAKTA